MTDPLSTALADLEATLAAVHDQADADYLARHGYVWHERGVGCDDLPDHRHGNYRIVFYPDPVMVERPA